MKAARAPSPPRRFRRRALGLFVAVGVLPLVVAGATAQFVTSRVLSISLAPLSDSLDAVDADLGRRGGDPALSASLDAARLELAQAELARRSLGRLAPVAFVAALALVGLLVVVGSALFSRGLSRPLEELAGGMRHLAGGDLDHRLPTRGGAARDEVSYLADQFNGMADELVVQRQRLKISEELAAWQDVARGLAHELKNPLTAMKMALARIARALERGPAPAAVDAGPGGPMRESVELLQQQLDVLIRMTQSFSDFARLPAPVSRPVDVGALVEEVCAIYRAASPVAIETEVRGALAVDGDLDQLRRAVGNLVKNAVEASAAGGAPIVVSARAGRDGDGEALVITVRDRGAGIAAPLRGGALTRSLGSTKPGGSGLGLPISHKIVHAHGGALTLEPRPDGGTEARIALPRAIGGVA